MDIYSVEYLAKLARESIIQTPDISAETFVSSYEPLLQNQPKGKSKMPDKDFSFNETGSKYLRNVPCSINGQIDVYAVLDAFAVDCPARQHAIKKLLCAGIRGKNSELDDLREAEDAVKRAIQMYYSRKA